MKKLISLLLALAMVMSVSPLTFAAGEYGENIALNKPVTITGEPYSATYTPDRLVDGKYNTTSAGGQGGDIYIGGVNKWSVVDLGGLYELSRVILYTRQDLDSAWARQGLGLAYGVEDDFSDMTEIGRKSGSDEFKSTLNVRLDDAPVARYVAMFGFGQAGNTAAELEVYGTKYEGKGSGDFTDLDTPTLNNAAKLVFNMGIMDGVNKTQFGKNKLITRGEAAKIICSMAGLSEPSGYRNEFLDVTAEHEYASYIQAGVDYGFISQDTHFRPDDYILGYELLKMILCVNGHYNTPAFGNVYPSKIIQIANDLDLLDGANTDGWSNIGRGSAAVVIYNALRSDSFTYQNGMFVKKDETLLETVFGCTFNTGTVTGNGMTTLTDPRDTINTSSIEISFKEYTDASGLGNKFLGEKVYFILDEEEQSVVSLWADAAKNSTVTIDAELIDPESTKSNIVIYDDNNKKTRYKVDGHAYTILNDVASGNITDEFLRTLEKFNGHITLLDNNNDGLYDVLKVYQPEILVVDSIISDSYATTLSIADKEGQTPVYDYEVVNVKNSTGATAVVDEIVGKLVYIYASENGALLNIQMMPEAIEAVANGKSGETVKLDGVEYEKTVYFEDNYASQVEIGKSATYYTDLNGKLVVMSNVAAQNSSQVMAVVQKFFVDASSEEYDIRIFDENGSFQNLQFSDYVVFDGTKKSPGELAGDALRNSLEGSLIYATISDDGVLKSIVTNASEERLQQELDSTGNPIYATGLCTDNAVYDGWTFKCAINPEAPIFTIPYSIDSDKPLIGNDFSSYYKVAKMNTVFKVKTEIKDEYEIYGYGEYREPSALIRKEQYSDGSTYYNPLINTHEDPPSVMIVNSTRMNVDEYGDTSYTIEGYDFATGSLKSFTAKAGLTHAVNYAALNNEGLIDSCERSKSGNGIDISKFVTNIANYESYLRPISELKKGEIIRYSKGNESNVSQLDLICQLSDYRGDKKLFYACGWDDGTNIRATASLRRTAVEDIKDGYIQYLGEGGVLESLALSGFSGPVIVIENNMIESFAASSAPIVLKDNDEIIVYMNSYKHVGIVCYRD